MTYYEERLKHLVSKEAWDRAGEIADAWTRSYDAYLTQCACVHCGAKHNGDGRKWLTETECWVCFFGEAP